MTQTTYALAQNMDELIAPISQEKTNRAEQCNVPVKFKVLSSRILVKLTIQILILLFSIAEISLADIRMPDIFGDHMILQQEFSIPVWGWADPNEEITIRLEDQLATAKADSQGKWRIDLKPLPQGSSPVTMTITGKNRISFTDILIGDVWLCSGQSNMEFQIKNPQMHPEFIVKDADREVESANYPDIRQFLVEKRVSQFPLDGIKGKWVVCSPTAVGEFTAVGYFFARELYGRYHIPIGLINSTVGGTPIEAWMSERALKSDPAFDIVGKRWQKTLADYPINQSKYVGDLAAWERRRTQAKENKSPFSEPPPRAAVGPGHRYQPSGLYNAMIHPLTLYGIRGVLWYQGENNTDRPDEYTRLFSTMIHDWRNAWNKQELPFYFVQLSSYQGLPGQDWAALREAQTQTLHIPKTGMAVTIDIGNFITAHPSNKQEVGRRLALIAIRDLYGLNVEAEGPTFRSFELQPNGTMLIHFDHAKGLHAEGGPPKGFEIAGGDNVFVPANIEVDGEIVIASSPTISHPVAVRYAWRNFPEVNLYNESGLPAVPFYCAP